MERAIKKLKKKTSSFFSRWNSCPKKFKNSRTVIRGDEKIKCISAASIVAKVYRDLYMIKLGSKFPQYWNKILDTVLYNTLMLLKKNLVLQVIIE